MVDNDEIPAFFFYNPKKAEEITKTGQALIREMEAKLKYAMKDMRLDIGSYYGNLVTLEEFIDNEEFSFETNHLQGRRDTIEYLEKFKNLGVAEILLDVNDGAADTIFFRINNNTDLASLMVHIHAWRPDEFTRQDNENWFRLWWD